MADKINGDLMITFINNHDETFNFYQFQILFSYFPPAFIVGFEWVAFPGYEMPNEAPVPVVGGVHERGPGGVVLSVQVRLQLLDVLQVPDTGGRVRVQGGDLLSAQARDAGPGPEGQTYPEKLLLTQAVVL